MAKWFVVSVSEVLNIILVFGIAFVIGVYLI